MAQARVLRGGWYWQRRKWRAGDLIEARGAQIAAWQADGMVEAAGRPTPERAVAPPPELADTPTPVPEKKAPEWPHKMPPAQYVNRFPDGPDADLARLLLGENKG